MTMINQDQEENKNEGKKRNPIKVVLLTILGFTLSVSIILGLIGWISGWRTDIQFSNGFFFAGGIIVIIGLSSLLGTFSARSNFGIIYSQSAGDMNLLDRAKLWVADIRQGYNMIIICTASGLILIGLAILIDQLVPA